VLAMIPGYGEQRSVGVQACHECGIFTKPAAGRDAPGDGRLRVSGGITGVYGTQRVAGRVGPPRVPSVVVEHARWVD